MHNFSYAKNLAIQKADIPYGDWILVIGSDFELLEFDKSFCDNELNFFGRFEVPEYMPDKDLKSKHIRHRKLLWRHHPMIEWEGCVHEECVHSAYRLTREGIAFYGMHWKEFPVVGKMIHYGLHDDGGENSRTTWEKTCYYAVLSQIDRFIRKYRLPNDEDGMLDALGYVYNNKTIRDAGVDNLIQGILDRYFRGEISAGLSCWSENAAIASEMGYD